MAISSGFVMSALMESCKTPLSVLKTTAQNNVIKIPVTDFAHSNYKLVRVSNYDYDLAVQKHSDGSYLALVMVCTHAGNPLTRTGNGYYCTLHGSKFDTDGHVLNGPAEKDLTHLHTQTDNNFLYIHLS
jgi:Rieske Fe-S protein